MSAIYDNWERLVAATLKKQQLWELFHAASPSTVSEGSDFNSSTNSSSPLHNQSQRVLPKFVLVSDFSPAFDVKNVYLDSAELLGRGTFGSAHRATMTNGVRIVVKRLKSLILSEQEFEHHVGIVGSIRHENVAPLRAYYSSEGERLMLHDYYSSESISMLLHGETVDVDWGTRLRIAVGAARGIAEIHKRNDGKLVHGNIKSSNVFLNPQQYGIVSDLGLTNMTSTKIMPGARCYAPEVKKTQKVSQESDVYSFGILLFEILTRESPEVVDLVKLVRSVKNKEMTRKVFDADILEHRAIRGQMVKVLEIGISCVGKSPAKRPKMSDVVKMLEHLTMMRKGSNIPLEKLKRKFVIVGYEPPTFAIEDVLDAFADFLGFGTYGTSYNAILRNGSTIMIKRLRDVNITFKEFKLHMKIIGRLSHANVARLKAFHSQGNDVLLMYDYCNGASVSSMLHGKKNMGSIPLNGETRLKIAVGAAKGIAYIHEQDDGKLVHGNVRSSNIFINGETYGVVSDVGLAKVMNHVRQSGMRIDYHAPEIKNSRKPSHSQACDVYNFGIVLLELISGRPPQWTTDDGRVVSIVSWIKWVYHNERTAQVLEEEAMVQMLLIAMDCVAIDPERRPKMARVVRMLEAIKAVQMESTPSTGSRLEDLLEELLPLLRRHE